MIYSRPMATKLRVSWPANAPAEQVTAYDVIISVNGTPQPVVEVPTNQLDITSPVQGVYSAQVRAKNVAGNSQYSSSGTGPLPPSTPPAPTITTIVE